MGDVPRPKGTYAVPLTEPGGWPQASESQLEGTLAEWQSELADLNAELGDWRRHGTRTFAAWSGPGADFAKSKHVNNIGDLQRLIDGYGAKIDWLRREIDRVRSAKQEIVSNIEASGVKLQQLDLKIEELHEQIFTLQEQVVQDARVAPARVALMPVHGVLLRQARSELEKVQAARQAELTAGLERNIAAVSARSREVDAGDEYSTFAPGGNTSQLRAPTELQVIAVAREFATDGGELAAHRAMPGDTSGSSGRTDPGADTRTTRGGASSAMPAGGRSGASPGGGSARDDGGLYGGRPRDPGGQTHPSELDPPPGGGRGPAPGPLPAAAGGPALGGAPPPLASAPVGGVAPQPNAPVPGGAPHGPYGAGMGPMGMGSPVGGQSPHERRREKRRATRLAPDQEIYLENRAWTAGLIVNAQRRRKTEVQR